MTDSETQGKEIEIDAVEIISGIIAFPFKVGKRTIQKIKEQKGEENGEKE